MTEKYTPGKTLSAPAIAPPTDNDWPSAPRAGDLLATRWALEAEIGRGATGRIFRAFDRLSQSLVALKIVHPRVALGPRVERLGRELRLARDVRHPNVCRVFEIGEADGHRYLVMELATGGTLRDGLRADAGLRSWAERLRDVRCVVDGVAAVHALGIVHRDIKPENTLRMSDGRLAITDFGLAVAPAPDSQLTTGVGTPGYMAPELVLDGAATLRSDVWSLGVLMHEVLFDARPTRAAQAGVVAASDAARALAMSGAAEPVATSGGSGAVSPASLRLWGRQERALRELCRWCLAGRAADRPRDAVVVARALDHALGGRWLRVRAARMPRTQRIGIASAAVLLVAAMGAVSFVRRPPAGLRAELASSVVPIGVPTSLSAVGARTLASFPGRVHCLSALAGGDLGVIWGDPRRAERVDGRTGTRSAWNLPSAADVMNEGTDFQFPDPIRLDCPQIAPDGKRLLYTATIAGQSRTFLDDGSGRPARDLLSGDLAVWHPGGDLIAFRVDREHPAIYDMRAGRLEVLPALAESAGPYLSELRFGKDGRQLFARGAGLGGYWVVRYDTVSRAQTGRVYFPMQDDRYFRATALGPARNGAVYLHALEVEGTSALGLLDWNDRTLRWAFEARPLDLTRSIDLESSGSAFVVRRWTSTLEIAEQTGVTRRLATGGRVFQGDVNRAGDVVVSFERQAGRLSLMLFPTSGGPPRTLTTGMAWSPRFTASGDALVYETSGSDGREEAWTCDLQGDCRRLAPLGAGDCPSLSASGDRLAFLNDDPYVHVAIITLRTKQRRMLAQSKVCGPRWLGEKVWVASGSDQEFDWVELDPETSVPTGRRIRGAGICGAVGPGPEGVLVDRVRIVNQEESQLLLGPALP